MRWYAERPSRRALQVAADAAVVLWVVLWWRIARATHDLVDALGAPGQRLETTGDRLANGFGDVADVVAGTPLLGDLLRSPFAELQDAAGSVAGIGAAQEAAAAALADWLAVLLVVVPAGLVVVGWLLLRWRRARRAGAAARLRDTGELDLLALRAIALQPLPRLLAVTSTPAADWRAGRVDDLAALELAALGLRDGRA